MPETMIEDAPSGNSSASAADAGTVEQRPLFEPPSIPSPATPEEVTPAVSIPSIPENSLSVKDMFLGADPVVQGVMLLLLLASVATWAAIIEKTIIIKRTSRCIWLFKKNAAQIADGKISYKEQFSEFTAAIAEAGWKESLDTAGSETRADYRERTERAMRGVLSGRLDRIGNRVLFLATVGSVSPFIGLFGTVWGIMHSFVGIAASGETTLAVVAPGIAEALFATAMGLVAAIPAVIAYNKITGTMKKITKEALAGISLLGNHLAKVHFRRLENLGG